MAKAGYCPVCQANVWLGEDGACAQGHPAELVTGIYEAEPATPDPIAPAPRPRSRKRSIIIAGIAVFLLVIIGLCAVLAFATKPLADKGEAVASEWQARLAEDYPGWKVLGFNYSTFSGSGGSQTEYAFGIKPPDRDFTIGVVYTSQDGEPPVCQDEILREGAMYDERAESLLDFIQETYVGQEKGIVSVESDFRGDTTVNWRTVKHVGPFSWQVGSFDELAYDETTESWSVAYSPEF